MKVAAEKNAREAAKKLTAALAARKQAIKDTEFFTKLCSEDGGDICAVDDMIKIKNKVIDMCKSLGMPEGYCKDDLFSDKNGYNYFTTAKYADDKEKQKIIKMIEEAPVKKELGRFGVCYDAYQKDGALARVLHNDCKVQGAEKVVLPIIKYLQDNPNKKISASTYKDILKEAGALPRED